MYNKFIDDDGYSENKGFFGVINIYAYGRIFHLQNFIFIGFVCLIFNNIVHFVCSVEISSTANSLYFMCKNKGATVCYSFKCLILKCFAGSEK